MRVFITGATGFAGSHLVEALLADGHSIWALMHPATSTQTLPEHPDCHTIEGDLLNLGQLREIVTGVAPEMIFHLAGQAYPARSWRNSAFTLAVNAGGTANLLEAAVEAGGPRTLVVTSAEIYGLVSPAEMPISEATLPDPRHPYGISKLAAAQLVRVFAERYALPVVEARPFNHIGPRQALGFVVPDFASQVAAIKLGRQAPLIRVGNLSAARDFSDVRDVVRAYRLLAERGTPGEPYLICSGSPVSIQTILNILLTLNDVAPQIEYDPERMRPSDVPVLFGSYAKIARDVGWQPTVSLRTSLHDVSAEWLERLAAEPSKSP